MHISTHRNISLIQLHYHRYLAKVTSSSSSSTGADHVGELEQKVLNTNQMLEAFGNARTLRNDNSSRFGKFIKIQFSSTGRIVGATIEKYLLEKTRITQQSEGERNFHIFYQLIRGASEQLRSAISLSTSMSSYNYLNSSSCTSIPGIDDVEEFKLTCECMSSIGITSAQQDMVFALMAGILSLGNVAFEEDSIDGTAKGLQADSQTHLSNAAASLGLEASALLKQMTQQNMHVGSQVIVKSQSCEQATDKRDSFAKTIYTMIFSWLVGRINETIAVKAAAVAEGFIGVLDIYGFENFDSRNGFEQLLINYANEKLQNHFNKHIFQVCPLYSVFCLLSFNTRIYV